ncbi:Monocarboxylate transporter 2 [Papilio xuthus]|uniref:Monocarboxylate transporter 2 n=1 Tax=Papilio xuthus TaxID=66420 RepID=A0A194PVC1_PAPXU|nr:Monocarboxylate transporter 2 [Papilio xuthus]
MTVKEVMKNKKYELVPPDGGWGYIATASFLGSFGIIFNELFIQLKMGSTSITLLNGINAMCVALSGFMTGPLLKFMSTRQLGMVAAFFINLGTFGTVFVNSKLLFFVCQGLLQNIGIGFLLNITYSVINEYFVKRRLLSLSVTQTIPAIIALFSPQLVNMVINYYGFRGAFILLSAINMHTFVAVCLMQPVAWHMKKIEIPNVESSEMKLLLVQDKTDQNIPCVKLSDKEKEVEQNIDKKGEKDLELDVATEKSKSIRGIILEAIDLKLMKTFILSNAGLGLAICGFADLTFTLMLPQTLYAMNWTEDEVARAVSLNCFGDLVTRILFIIGSSWLVRFESQQIYLVGLFLAVTTRLGMLGFENVTTILTFLTIMGVSKCTIIMLIPQVIAEAVKPEQFTSAMGIFMLSFGFINLSFGPIIGAVRDLTDSYPTAIYIITSCFGIVIMFWIVEMVYKKNKHKRKPNTQISKKGLS